jgi:D-alanyl-lipoteichoic acid acyltransferase DltB (MBOAT superfamily)
MGVFMQIYVVDSLDRERIGEAKQEFQVVKSNFTIILIICVHKMPCVLLQTNANWVHGLLAMQAIINGPLMLNGVILVFANKQDLVSLCYFLCFQLYQDPMGAKAYNWLT